VKIGIVGITNVVPGKKPVAEITISDSLDQPVDRLGQVTPGPVTPGFVLASWDADKRQYFAYTTRIRSGVTNPATDQNGTWTDLELGHAKYTFGTILPADFDVTKMLTLGVQASRVMPAEVLDGKTYYADNVFKDFRADGRHGARQGRVPAEGVRVLPRSEGRRHRGASHCGASPERRDGRGAEGAHRPEDVESRVPDANPDGTPPDSLAPLRA